MPQDNALKSSVAWRQVCDAIGEATGAPFHPRTVADIGGGCINRAVRLSDGWRSYFVKLNEPASVDMFEAEREGLATLAAAGAVRVPAPLAAGSTTGFAFLVLELIPLRRLSRDGWAALGEQLAALHRSTAPQFGWHRSNTIGATPQTNPWTASWIEFWRRHRLGYQLEIAAGRGLDAATLSRGKELLDRLGGLLADYHPRPSLLHGDLWSGNVAADEQGGPVLFDPAVYYGDREADLAMSELFGRFDEAFYQAYREAWPPDPGYESRKTLYNLYHVLNHFNLFGGGYAGRARAMIEDLLAR
ncbi:MAG: fructosamine kinase family protein [Arenicellales bacterium]|jgi:fructosamine-3-kinase